MLNLNLISGLVKMKEENSKVINNLIDKMHEKSNLDTDAKERIRLSKELLLNLNQARAEWEQAIQNYEFAHEQELIDYYTYKIKAAQTKYQYLLKRIKEETIKYNGKGLKENC